MVSCLWSSHQSTLGRPVLPNFNSNHSCKQEVVWRWVVDGVKIFSWIRNAAPFPFTYHTSAVENVFGLVLFNLPNIMSTNETIHIINNYNNQTITIKYINYKKTQQTCAHKYRKQDMILIRIIDSDNKTTNSPIITYLMMAARSSIRAWATWTGFPCSFSKATIICPIHPEAPPNTRND